MRAVVTVLYAFQLLILFGTAIGYLVGWFDFQTFAFVALIFTGAYAVRATYVRNVRDL